MISDVISGTIAALIGNYMTTCFVIGLIVGAVQVAVARGRRGPGRRSAVVVSGYLLNAFLFWAVGIGMAINFVMHSVFGDYAAETIGWAQSPFQLELALSSLGFAIIAIIIHRRRSQFSAKAAVIIGVAVMGLGAAAGHVYQMIVNHDYAVNNTGLLLGSDIAINLFGIALVIWHGVVRHREPGATDASYAAPAAGVRENAEELPR
jgi:hypothetical protein